MSDKIINMLEDVQACAQFEYKGWTISMSTIVRKGRVEVLAWKDEDKSFNTVQEAIEYINNLE